MGAVGGQDLGADFGELGGADAWADLDGHSAQGFGDDLAAGAEFFELLSGGDGHEASSTGDIEFRDDRLKDRHYTSCSRNHRRSSLRRLRTPSKTLRRLHYWNRLWS
jgi:hypothetical protein